MHDDLYPYHGLSAEQASRKAVELVKRCAAGHMGWVALAGELRKLEFVYAFDRMVSAPSHAEARHG